MNMKLVRKLRSSPFRQMNGGVATTKLVRFWNTLMAEMKWNAEDCTLEEFDLQEFIPPYQRDGDKWTEKMQTKYIENTLRGAVSPIVICRVGDSMNGMVLDGQQRLISIIKFLKSELPIFDGQYYNEIKEEVKVIAINLQYHVINAENPIDEVQYYIDMNEGFTHSKEDIDRAKEYLRKLEKEIK